MNLSIGHRLNLNTSKDFSLKDYYPFGMLMPGRNFSSENYRFGYGDQEIDNEINGTGNSLSFTFRIYDPRLGRFLSNDPLTRKYPWLTPYQYAGNSPIASIDVEGKESVEANIAIWIGLWSAKLEIASSDIIQASGGTSNYSNTYVPQDVQKKLNLQRQSSGAQVYGEALRGTANATVDVVTSLPGAETVGDFSGALYYAAQGDYVSAGTYGVAIFVPAISGAVLKQATPLIKGTIKLFESGKEVEREAFKFGNYGHPGEKSYNTIVNSVKNGGDYVASSMDEAMEFLNAAFKDNPLPNETGKATSKYGYRVDIDEVKDGLRQGHQGSHINYYDKEKGIKGSISIEL
mgnify:CR=1 FL=1